MSMVRPAGMFFIALAHSTGFLFFNVYPIIRLRADPGWGGNGSGVTASYGFPLNVGTSAGCFIGSQFYYGNLVINLILWNAIALAFIASPFVTSIVMPFLVSCTRTVWQAGVKSVSDAFNYGGAYPDKPL
jgi:hypothetical protein